MKILHIITSVNSGGAENMLYKLLSRQDRRKYEVEVISLTDIGPRGKDIQALGIEVRALGMRAGFFNPFLLFRLAMWIRQAQPDIVQTWLYHADLFGGIATKIAGLTSPILWGIRIDGPGANKGTVLAAKLSAMLSGWIPRLIICCAHSVKKAHQNFRTPEQNVYHTLPDYALSLL